MKIEFIAFEAPALVVVVVVGGLARLSGKNHRRSLTTNRRPARSPPLSTVVAFLKC